MPKTDSDPLGEGFRWRLRAELNRITPRYSPPRYLSPAPHRVGAWRLAPAVLAAGVVGMLGLTAYAATGSPNPAVWTRQIVIKIEPSAAPESGPGSTESPPAAAPAPAKPTEHDQATPGAEPSERPEATPSPDHEGGGGDGGSGDDVSGDGGGGDGGHQPSTGSYGGDH